MNQPLDNLLRHPRIVLQKQPCHTVKVTTVPNQSGKRRDSPGAGTAVPKGPVLFSRVKILLLDADHINLLSLAEKRPLHRQGVVPCQAWSLPD